MPSGSSEIDLARYQLLRLLGRGGMGEVYLAEDQVLHRHVAIKFVAADRISDPEARRRLLHEARSAAGLDHEGICTVFEAGPTTDGRDCIVMQYVQGETLTDALHAGPLPADRALELCMRIAEALQAAHRQGVVHRDLKPGNIMITPSGRPKLLDFGIAKLVPTPEALEHASTVSGVTTKGTIVGTPSYMSPEQIAQRSVDGRSDLFSLGAVLYECLTGRRAFDKPSTFETIADVLHTQPVRPTTLRPELIEAHDRLCFRLLAKDPADRFQSAEEVIGAIRLAKSPAPEPAPPDPSPRFLWRALAVVAVLGIAAFAVWKWRQPHPLPEPPAAAARWYQKGTDAVREGAYLAGRTALEEAVRLFPSYVLAYARLAEANAELDDERAAQGHLLRVANLVPNESRLPELERLRIDAARSLVLREVDRAVALYRQIAERTGDADAWLDLGRAQETAGLRSEARASYERAIARDGQYAAAYLRLGDVHGLESRQQDALAAFARAERLYQVGSDVEGRTELLLRRGSMFDAFGQLKQARADLEQARALAGRAGARYQEIRSRLALSSVMASEGALQDAERMATAAVQDASGAGLDTVAADGLIDLAATLADRERTAEADATLQRALRLAEERGARRTAARARLQLASLREAENRSKEALDIVQAVLPFLRANRYRRFELTGLAIAARAHERLGELGEAREISSSVLSVAERLKDDAAIALAAANLASVLTTLGELPEALRLRERAEGIYRDQGSETYLAYALANHADVLIRLGRADVAAALLGQLEAGIAAGKDPYVGRARRVYLLRAMAAATALRCEEALTWVERIETPDALGDSPAMLGPAIGRFCRAHLGRPAAKPGTDSPQVDPAIGRERQYWLAFAALERNDAQAALNEGERGLALLGTVPNDELRWRLSLIGAAAARQAGDQTKASTLATLAATARKQLDNAWKEQVALYEKRPDLVYLSRRLAASRPGALK
jgi:tetratricopeptide (TPR) repeat protein/tRNA A-37 threonylcarbamoyl transferase component Bud32